MLNILEFLFGPLRDRLYNSYFRSREQQKDICREAVSRMKKERRNFEHIVAGEGYNSAAHERAVEQLSFELLLEVVAKLQKVRKFRKRATLLLEQIDARNAAEVLEAINRIEPKLEKFADT